MRPGFKLYFDAGPTLAQEYGHGLFGMIIFVAERHVQEDGDESELRMAGLMNALQHPEAAPMPLLTSKTLSQSPGPQLTSVASDPSSAQPSATGVSNSAAAQRNVLTLASAGEPMPQTGNSRTILDMLDGLFGGLTNGQNDVLGSSGCK
jgi:hypothetical protein